MRRYQDKEYIMVDDGKWPYHEDPHGNMVRCASNPCSWHSASEHFMASNEEEATELRYGNDYHGLTESTTVDRAAVRNGVIDYIKNSGRNPDDWDVERATDMVREGLLRGDDGEELYTTALKETDRTASADTRAEQDRLNSRLADYAPAGWNGWHLETVNGGQYADWQGGLYNALNRHLDEIDADKDIPESRKSDYKSYIVSRLNDHHAVLWNANTIYADLPSDYVQDPSLDYLRQSLHGGRELLRYYGRGEVKSPYVLKDMGNPNALLDYDKVSKITMPNGTNGADLMRQLAREEWGDLVVSETEQGGSDDYYHDTRDALGHIQYRGLAAKRSQGYSDGLKHRDFREFGAINSMDAVFSAMETLDRHRKNNSELNDVDIRVISRKQLHPDDVFWEYEKDIRTSDEVEPKTRKALRDRRRSAAIIRVTALANRMRVSTSRIYGSMSRSNGLVRDIMTMDMDTAEASLKREWGIPASRN